MKENSISRRSFLKSSALAGAAGMVGTGSILTSCEGGDDGVVKYTPIREPGSYYIPDLPDLANDGRELKAGVIACGSRGSGAALNFLRAAKNVKITALGDTYGDRIDQCVAGIKRAFPDFEISDSMKFTGLDNYKKVVDSGVDVIITAAPPFFRPAHFAYAVEKGKHCFIEKPLFVDSVGYRSIMATARQAQQKNLAVVTGTQRHHQRSYVESYKRIMEGMIGEITGGAVYWNQNQLWFNERKPAYRNELEWMIRDWVNWTWLSGDHIVEQHVHNLDVWTWFTGMKPISAKGFGSRQRRVTGDQFDNFSVDFTMENGIHVHSMCRQINGCTGPVAEFIQGTKGSWSSIAGHVIKDLAGNEIWKYDADAEKETYQQTDPYTLEHVNWINHIRAGKSIDQASETAVANMAALMGRQSAYTGRDVTWDEMATGTLDLTPLDISYDGKMDLKGYVVPVPGMSNEEVAARAAEQRAARAARQQQQQQ